MRTSKRRPLPRTEPVQPPRLPFTAAEQRVIARLRTPAAVQDWLNNLPYNQEKGGETLRSFRGVVRDGTAHCLEAALSAAKVKFEVFKYPGTQHGFHNDTTPRYDEAAAKLAWQRTLALFKRTLVAATPAPATKG